MRVLSGCEQKLQNGADVHLGFPSAAKFIAACMLLSLFYWTLLQEIKALEAGGGSSHVDDAWGI